MAKKELYNWLGNASASEPPCPNGITLQQQELIAALLRHENGASIVELLTVAKCSSTQVRSSIRKIMNEGGLIAVFQWTADEQQAFRLTN